MPVKKMWLRLQILLSLQGTFKTEFWNFLMAVCHGIFFMLPFSTFITLPEHGMLNYGTKPIWGIVLVVLGLLKFYFLLKLNHDGRKVTAAVLSIVWFAVFVQLVLYAPQSPTMVSSLVLTSMAAYTFWRL